jgi:general secretion pathway protein E
LPLAERFSIDYLQQYRILPLECDDLTLRVAIAGEPDEDVGAHLEQTYGKPAAYVRVAPIELDHAIASAYAPNEASLRSDAAGDDPSDSISDARDLATQPPVIRLVNILIRDALRARASDLHFEATERGLVVRMRVDGVMSTVGSPDRSYQAAVISRLKLLAELNIAEQRRPQDGRMRLRFDDAALDIRVSAVPTLLGESVVLRLLNTSSGPLGLQALGLPRDLEAQLGQLVRQNDGLLLATGPTGSGKTTTLHSALMLRTTEREKIITVEDPVEVLVPGVTQVPVVAAAGVTFPSVLRSILRQDPDVVMVGEMRDRETASIAAQAALTGHLVLSTLHTNNAASAVTRLVDIGLEPFVIAATLRGVLTQRLVRRLCRECRTPGTTGELIPAADGSGWGVATSYFAAYGCEKCRHTGYLGRTGIYELLPVTSDVRRMIREGQDAEAIASSARSTGMRTLYEDAADKVASGVTSPAEVRRVLGGLDV